MLREIPRDMELAAGPGLHVCSYDVFFRMSKKKNYSLITGTCHGDQFEVDRRRPARASFAVLRKLMPPPTPRQAHN
uniref:Uncharacterized protein n=1 Tax=Strigamia maritima TaxID=126957 RepID=T1IQN3_STRMM